MLYNWEMGYCVRFPLEKWRINEMIDRRIDLLFIPSLYIFKKIKEVNRMAKFERSMMLSHNKIMKHIEGIKLKNTRNMLPYLNLNDKFRVRSIKFHELYMDALRQCYEIVESQNVSDEQKTESFKDLFVENIRLISDGIPQKTLCDFIVDTMDGMIHRRGSIVNIEVESPIIQTDMDQTPPISITNLNFVVQPEMGPRVRIPMEKLMYIYAIPMGGHSRRTRRSKRSKRSKRSRRN